MLGKTLVILPAFSVRLLGYSLVVHLGALVCLLFSAISGVVLMLLGSLILISFFEFYRRSFISAGRIVRLELADDGKAVLQRADGMRLDAELEGQAVVSDYVAILHFRHVLGLSSLVLCPDACGDRTYHLLRISLLQMTSV